jgi:chorismate mutase
LVPLKDADKIFDQHRYDYVVSSRVRWAKEIGVDAEFAQALFHRVMTHSFAVQKDSLARFHSRRSAPNGKE